jgi:hypothetical protein
MIFGGTICSPSEIGHLKSQFAFKRQPSSQGLKNFLEPKSELNINFQSKNLKRKLTETE